MIKVLLVTSSVLGDTSMSRKIAMRLIEGLSSEFPDLQLITRDATTLPLISLDYLRGLGADPTELSDHQKLAVNLGDQIIEEVEQAAVVIVTAPMYSYTIPAALKIWIEYLNRPGRVFEHRPEGAVGLLTGKKVCAVLTRGSSFEDEDPMNFQENLLVSVLDSFGLSPVNIILAQGTAHEGSKAALADAGNEAEKLGNSLAKELFRENTLVAKEQTCELL
jgi:FMN-dependent NADH-azoreductase